MAKTCLVWVGLSQAPLIADLNINSVDNEELAGRTLELLYPMVFIEQITQDESTGQVNRAIGYAPLAHAQVLKSIRVQPLGICELEFSSTIAQGYKQAKKEARYAAAGLHLK